MFKSAALVIAGVMMVAAQAQAQDIHIKTGDLDLRRPEQAHVLQQRIVASAREWCAAELRTGTHLRESGCVERVQAIVTAELPDSMRREYRVALDQNATAPAAQLAAR